MVAVVVTHRRLEQLRASLEVVCGQTRPVDHLVVVDNADENAVRELVEAQPVEATYLGSKHNLGGAGGFALGMLHALATGADLVWCADDDGRPEGPEVLATLMACMDRHGLAEVSPVVCDLAEPDRLAFPLRRGVVWRRWRSELFADDKGGRVAREAGPTGAAMGPTDAAVGPTDAAVGPTDTAAAVADGSDLLPGIASLFNGALFTADCLDRVGVPDLRLFIRGDEVEMHRRLVRSRLPFGTCLTTAYLHPQGSDEFKPILGGRMHTQFPDDPVKRHFTYRNRGYVLTQPGNRRLIPQEILRFGWYFLVTRRDPAGLREWMRLQRLGAGERFDKP
ncbi:glycosyl transferase [Dietzia sp. DQ12-45-1b]|nr:glycosyl transferase [Dietzia sp. DQ12-45-1b]